MDLTISLSKKRKCKQQQEEEEEKEDQKTKNGIEDQKTRNGINSLPREIAIDIISRLPVSSVVQFRYVSRGCRSLTHDPLLVKLLFSRTVINNPCLIFHCDYPIRNQLYFVDFDDQIISSKETAKRIHTPFCAAMPEFYIVGSCNGLLCLSDSLYNDKLYIYNPFTRDYKELPKSQQFREQEVVFGFGFNPITNEYKIIKVIYYRNANHGLWRGARGFRIRNYPESLVQIFSISSGESGWRSTGKAPYQLDRSSSSSEALVNGRLHWVTQTGRQLGARGRAIVSLDIHDEQFREVPRPECGVLYRRNYHLTVIRGCLSAAVSCSYGKLEIWVMKEYDSKDSWVKEFNIGVCSPKFLKQDYQRAYGIWRNTLRGQAVRVLCVLKSGEILMEYKGGSLVCYDPENGSYRNLVFQGMPNLFQTCVHVGSLNWIDNPIV